MTVPRASFEVQYAPHERTHDNQDVIRTQPRNSAGSAGNSFRADQFPSAAAAFSDLHTLRQRSALHFQEPHSGFGRDAFHRVPFSNGGVGDSFLPNDKALSIIPLPFIPLPNSESGRGMYGRGIRTTTNTKIMKTKLAPVRTRSTASHSSQTGTRWNVSLPVHDSTRHSFTIIPLTTTF